jgi:hypothetical protein
MNEMLLFLHFFGLMLGAAGGIGSGVIMRRAMALPDEQAQTVRRLGPLLNTVALAGIALLWITGLILVWSKWNGFVNLPGAFWIKFVFVILLTVFSGLARWIYVRARSGDMSLVPRLPVIGMAGGLSAVLAVLFAVYAFG